MQEKYDWAIEPEWIVWKNIENYVNFVVKIGNSLSYVSIPNVISEQIRNNSIKA